MGSSFREILRLESVASSLSASTKDGAIAELSRLLAKSLPDVDSDVIRRVLVERERLASTGVGSGVAIPHGRIAKLDAVRAALAVHRNGLHFDAIDGEPVHLFVAIVVPDTDPTSHLRLLARASRILRDASLRERLRACEDEASLHGTFLSYDLD